MRTPAQLRRDLSAILADLPRVLAQDMSAEMRREHERAGRRARLRLRWLSHMPDAGIVLALERNLRRRLKRGLGEREVPLHPLTGDRSLFDAVEREHEGVIRSLISGERRGA